LAYNLGPYYSEKYNSISIATIFSQAKPNGASLAKAEHEHEHLSNRVFKNYEEIVKCCAVAWNSFVDEEGNIKSLCSRAWAQV
jgi:hypothetical protein